jgi:hypothetical protein
MSGVQSNNDDHSRVSRVDDGSRIRASSKSELAVLEFVRIVVELVWFGAM